MPVKPMPFAEWVRTNAFALLGTGFIAALSNTIVAVIKVSRAFENSQLFLHPKLWIFSLQVILVLAAMLWVKPWRTAFAALDKSTGKSPLKSALNSFRMWWRILLLTWGITYVLYFLQEVCGMLHVTLTISPSFLVVLAKVEIASFIGLYLSISRKMTDDIWTWMFAVMLLFILLCAEIVIQQAGATRFPTAGKVVNAISCSLLCVAIAMFIGRLDTQRIVIHPLVLFFCYAYAAIQPIFPLVNDDYGAFLFAGTLLFKTMLFVVVTYLVGTKLLEKFVGAILEDEPFNVD